MSSGHLTPVGLRCAHKVDPLAVEPDRARFSWAVAGPGTGRRQTAYQLVVADAEVPVGGEAVAEEAGTVWDSGRVLSEGSADVAYSGAPLAAAHPYSWRVRVWDEAGEPGPWSERATFETALGGRGAWAACWVGLGPGRSHFDVPSGEGLIDPVRLAMKPAPYLRREFRIEGTVLRARLYTTALGVYEVRLNGRRVSDDVLAPGWTDYDRRLLYQCYDVTHLLVAGDNVLAAVVADGWACGFYGFDGKRSGAHYARSPQLLSQLLVRFSDGREERLGTDDRWRSAVGAVAYADLLMGERREPAHEPAGWDAPGYDASSWRPVSCRPLGDSLLVADPGPPVRVTEEVPATSVSALPGGRALVDFGQNLAGWVRLRADRPAGTVIEVSHGEVLNPDGSLYVLNLRTARQQDAYVATGGAQVLEPRFTFHGFRYAEVTGLGPDAAVGDFTACAVQSDTPRTGQWECSSPALNQLWANIDWGQRSNFISVPTDCPQRDERLGWLGDAQVFARTAAYNRDVASFFCKWLDDVADAQLPSGAFPDFAPTLGHDWGGSPAWADAGVIVPWTVYKMYGDTGVLERHFERMEAWMGYLDGHNPDRLWRAPLGSNYGDWLTPKEDSTPPELLASAYWAYDAALMAEIAQAIGRPQKAEEYAQLGREIRGAFQNEYVSPDGTVASGTQTAYVLALHMGLVPEGTRPASARRLVDAIAAEDWHLTTGFVGVGYLLPVLSANGYTDVAYRLLEQRTYPSWLYPVDRGATTVWERWDGWTEERGFQSPTMNSFNHYALGSVGEWLYRFVLGIELAPGAAGFDRLVLRPHPGGSLEFARGSFRSVRGEIVSGWRREGDMLHLDVTLPPNVAASVRVPSSSPGDVVGPAGAGPGRVAAYPGAIGGEEAVFDVGSGSFSFSGPAPKPGGAGA